MNLFRRKNLLLAAVVLVATNSYTFAEESSESDSSSKAKAKEGPPPFFLQDSTDGLCLTGEKFERCNIDALFYVVGKPGDYQIHKRPRVPSEASDAESEDGICISKKSCEEKDQKSKMDVKLTKCTHCGAKKWNILGDASTGYVLSEGDGKICLSRDLKTNTAMTGPCDDKDTPYTPLQLQFASKPEIAIMSSDAALMIAAAGDGDLSKLKSILETGKDGEKELSVNSRDWDQLSALIPAAHGGHLDVVKFLIAEGIEVDGSDKDGITALMEASVGGHIDVVTELLAADATIDATSRSGVTALWLAASEGKIEPVKVLLEAGADPNIKRSDGIYPLLSACANGYLEVAQALIDADVDVTATDAEGLNALMNASEDGNVELMKILLSAMVNAKVAEGVFAEDEARAELLNQFSNQGYTALIIAAASGKVDAVKFLLSEGANADSVHDTGVTALMYAAASGHHEAMRVLIEEGNADISATHTNEGNALLEASTGGNTDAVKLLIEKGADIKVIDKDGVSAVMSSASQGNLELVELLLNQLKASGMSDTDITDYVNLPAKSGGTALMFAASAGKTDVAKLLIDYGAEVNAIAQATEEYLENLAEAIESGQLDETETEPHVDGVTSLHVAVQGGHLDCATLLLDNDADTSIKDDDDRTPLLMAVKGNYGEIASLLIARGADPNTVYVDDEGVSHNLLMDAIIVENDEFASLLITSGADIYYVDDTSVSTLLQASHRGMDEIVKLLLEKHSQMDKPEDNEIQSKYLDYPSEEGITPLIASASEGHSVILKMLVDAKPDINAKDKDGTNALMAASARGHVEPVQILLDAGSSINEQNEDGHSALMFAYNGKNQVATLWERYAQFVAEEGDGKVVDGDGGDELDDNGTGPVIREALDNHTKLVNILLERGADVKLKDKEGHMAKDFDFHPDLDGDVISKQEKKEKLQDESKNEL
mmetsp:Transcript_37064/g.54451  ORF Transcript_37064/g.54451 Transcript_37064/m.54451 type:complete len:947 (-) Transcript_37064:79-2919(-)|eukprot:CAMPEP_0195516226 /NCGR_PEP_ID=MMETSP0794_2-20130614/7011_1 /TAXON_ID=515487 /ORGANISM="Stephanopyxis turris, Strain CCMP 815" /LENGTH=946 /DNA_ID=CAMNT_0040644769 /DNA_START=216 /DNA_END=3056 /DNA_ORIENTATION=-